MDHRILVPVDGCETSERGVREAVALADQKAALRFLHVVDTTPLYMGFAAAAAEPVARSSPVLVLLVHAPTS